MSPVIQPIRPLLQAQLICAICISMTAFMMSKLGAQESFRYFGIIIPMVSGFVSALIIIRDKNNFQNFRISVLLSTIFQFVILALYSYLSGERLGAAFKIGDGILIYSAVCTVLYLFIFFTIYTISIFSESSAPR